MPQDSTNILLHDSILAENALQDSLHHFLYAQQEPAPHVWHSIRVPGPGGITMFILVILIMGMVLYWLPLFGKRVFQLLRDRKLFSKARMLYWQRHAQYDKLLAQYMPYYRKLDSEKKELFLHRTLIFMSAKEFKFNDIEKEDRIPLLISAAAIQLTFGLDHYMLDYFTTIYVLPNKYRYGGNEVPFQGHVSDDGIYFSWENFLQAFANYNDGDNVGLHEMAHALAFVNVMEDEGGDDGFRSRFTEFSKTGKMIFEEIQVKGNYLLGSYAATNYNEFWAVSVEKFFEQPAAFRALLPELYKAMCELLNQDPLSRELFLHPIEEIYNQHIAKAS